MICLTATPDDGQEEGSERSLINSLKFKRIYTENIKDFEEIKISDFFRITILQDVID